MLQAMCLAWLSQLMGVTVVHAPLRHWLKLFYASMCTFVLFGLDQVCSLVDQHRSLLYCPLLDLTCTFFLLHLAN